MNEIGPWFHHIEGQLVEREATCECRAPFTQRQLSERFMRMVEKRANVAAFTKQIPGLWVPVHCPKCERRDIGLQARLDEMRAAALAGPGPVFGDAA